MIDGPSVLIFEPYSKPLGLTYKEWSKEWCIWLLSFPKQKNPACHGCENSNGESPTRRGVTFLCQTFESVRPRPYRSLKVSGSYFFMPIINWISTLGENEKNEFDLANLAKARMDEVVKLDVRINGFPLPVELKNYRLLSPLIEMTLPDDNILGVEPGRTSVVADGYWIFFHSLKKIFDIETFGACRSGNTEIGIKYHIELCN
jgi:hypothetical protein